MQPTFHDSYRFVAPGIDLPPLRLGRSCCQVCFIDNLPWEQMQNLQHE